MHLTPVHILPLPVCHTECPAGVIAAHVRPSGVPFCTSITAVSVFCSVSCQRRHVASSEYINPDPFSPFLLLHSDNPQHNSTSYKRTSKSQASSTSCDLFPWKLPCLVNLTKTSATNPTTHTCTSATSQSFRRQALFLHRQAHSSPDQSAHCVTCPLA